MAPTHIRHAIQLIEKEFPGVFCSRIKSRFFVLEEREINDIEFC